MDKNNTIELDETDTIRMSADSLPELLEDLRKYALKSKNQPYLKN
jgi:folate-binding Fe-S cluster repair protein YgfZ